MMVVTPRHRGFFCAPQAELLSFPYLPAEEEEEVVGEKYEFGAGKLGIDFTMSIVYT
jgi:hypothetical protein